MTRNMIFLHGLESSSQTYKAGVIRQSFPELIVPDFSGPLENRMQALYPILGDKKDWTIIGSSFGGLMGALYAAQNPERVRKLILLAPALIFSDFTASLPEPVHVPTVVYHGRRDETIPIQPVQELCERIFLNLDFHAVDDDHKLHRTVESLHWPALAR